MEKIQTRVQWILFFRCSRSTLSEYAPTTATALNTAAFNFHEISEEKLDNLQLQYHERISVYLSSSSIQISPRFLFSSKLYLGFIIKPICSLVTHSWSLCSFIQSKYKQSLWRDPHFSKREVQIVSTPEALGMALIVCELQLMTKASCLRSKEVLKLCSTMWHDLRQSEEQNASTPFHVMLVYCWKLYWEMGAHLTVRKIQL